MKRVIVKFVLKRVIVVGFVLLLIAIAYIMYENISDYNSLQRVEQRIIAENNFIGYPVGDITWKRDKDLAVFNFQSSREEVFILFGKRMPIIKRLEMNCMMMEFDFTPRDSLESMIKSGKKLNLNARKSVNDYYLVRWCKLVE